MKHIFSICFIFLLFSFAYSNDENISKGQLNEIDVMQNISFRAFKNPYISVVLQDSVIVGSLMGMESDSLLLKVERSSTLPEYIQISVNEVTKIMEYERSKSGGNILTGFLVGAGLGAIIGYAQGDDYGPNGIVGFSAEGYALAFGTGLGLLGGTIGALFSPKSGRHKIYDLSDLNYFQKVQIIRGLSGY